MGWMKKGRRIRRGKGVEGMRWREKERDEINELAPSEIRRSRVGGGSREGVAEEEQEEEKGRERQRENDVKTETENVQC